MNRHCPKCNSEDIIPIIYGYPDNEMFEESDNDKCILGGCCISPHEVDDKSLDKHHCKNCGFEW
ncbi:MAG: hypothetical protein Q4F66_04435 [Clostridium sp.]|nr:hypothetical protein [Clostridium sp.]